MVYIKAFIGITANGLLSSHKNTAAKFSSLAVMNNIQSQLAKFDTVLIGASTVRAYGSTLTPKLRKPQQVVYSSDGSKLPSSLQFFRQRNVKHKTLLLSGQPSASINKTDWDTVLVHQSWQQSLANLNATNVACLGGSHLIKELVASKLLDEMEVTISPLMFSSGVGLDIGVNLKLLKADQLGQEVILTYRLLY